MLKVSEAAEAIVEDAGKGSNFLVYSHIDADGIAATSVMGAALARAEAPFRLRTVRQIDRNVVAEASAEKPDALIFVEIGSGYLDLIGSEASSRRVLVIDHHPPSGTVGPNMIHVNPHEYGFDGARDIGGAGVVYLVAKAMDQANVDLSALATVGALGDMQDKGDKRSLVSLNRSIVEDGVKAGCLETSTDLVFYGRETKPICKAIAHATNPFLPGLSGREDQCVALLASINLPLKEGDRWRTISDLSSEEKQKLLTRVIEHFSSKGYGGDLALKLIGTVYTLTHEKSWTPTRDAREFAFLLNACGRTGNQSLGISVGMGDRGQAMDEVQKVLVDYRRTLAQYMDWLSSEPSRLKEYRAIYVVDGEDVVDEKMTGPLSSILSSNSFLNPDKAVLVLAKTKEGETKISLRGTEQLISRGVNLGLILQNLIKKYSGVGGGHDIAAGAQIPFEVKDEFIRDVDEAILGKEEL